MKKDSLLVVALGGNAISRDCEEGNVDQQFFNSAATAVQLADLISSGFRLVVTHGNGPQIGNFLLRNEAGAGQIYSLPMEVAVAHVQGGMGFMIAQTLTNELSRRNDPRVVTSIVTTVLVDPNDPSFQHPTKPIGRTMTTQEAQRYIQQEQWAMKETSPGKWRRVVASPDPKQVMEINTIRRAVQANDVLVACGGGGVPVVRDGDGNLQGTRAVIDKDLASSLLAVELEADAMLILTAVERVCVRFEQPDQRELDSLTIAEAKRLQDAGEFPAGSMGPKIEGAIRFVERSANPFAFAVIGGLDRASDALYGKTGTRITR